MVSLLYAFFFFPTFFKQMLPLQSFFTNYSMLWVDLSCTMCFHIYILKAARDWSCNLYCCINYVFQLVKLHVVEEWLYLLYSLKNFKFLYWYKSRYYTSHHNSLGWNLLLLFMNVFCVKMCNIYTVNQNNDKQPRDGTKKEWKSGLCRIFFWFLVNIVRWLLIWYLRMIYFAYNCKNG